MPEVLSAGPGWLHTAGLPGRSAVDPLWVDEPRTAARAIGTGLRHLHDTLPVADCPFGRPSWVPFDAPPADRLVVCHGDACAPNTLMADDGTFCGHVDLGDLGVADRWADLAIATHVAGLELPRHVGGPTVSTAVLLDAYGVTADTGRMAYYRRSWRLNSPADSHIAGKASVQVTSVGHAGFRIDTRPEASCATPG